MGATNTLQRQLAAAFIALIITLIGGAINSGGVAGFGVGGLIIVFLWILIEEG